MNYVRSIEDYLPNLSENDPKTGPFWRSPGSDKTHFLRGPKMAFAFDYPILDAQKRWRGGGGSEPFIARN